MFPPLSEIKRQRKLLDLNQKQLADKAEVSQSLIAKIESGKVEPTYNNAVRIFQSLNELKEKEELKAKDLWHTKVFFAQMSDSVHAIAKLMKEKGVSQLPVLYKEKVCGLITESIILKRFSENPAGIIKIKVGDLMEEAPPIVSKETGLKMLLELLKTSSVLLVAEKGEIKGIISKADLLGRI